MPAPALAAVNILSVPREKLSHDSRNTVLSAAEEKMNVIVRQDPGVDGTFPLDDVFAQPLDE